MGKTYNATLAYGNKWSQADKKISEAVATKKRIPFFVHELSPTLEKAIQATSVEDVNSHIIPLWKKPDPISVKDFSPDALQGYHGISLEKALRVRYQSPFMKNAKKAYEKASDSIGAIAEYENKFPKDLQFEQ